MIATKPKLCGVCHQIRPLFRSNPPTCQSCARKQSAQQAALNKAKTYKQVTLVQTEDGEPGKPVLVYSTKQIKSVSTRQQKLNAAYLVLRKQFMKSHKICQAGLDNCTFQATECHHRRGRGEYLLDSSTYLALCASCHKYINEHNAFAFEKGFSLSRLSKAV